MDFNHVEGLIQQGYSRRRIAVLLGVSRNTLKKYLDPGAPRPDRDADGRPVGKLEPYLDTLRTVLEENARVRAIEAYKRLRAQGYVGGYDLVRKRMRDIRRREIREREPQATSPGQRAEVDLGRIRVHGMIRFLFTMKLCHSERLFATLMERPDLDSFLDCHRQAFRFFQGAPAEVAYCREDNKWIRRLVGGIRIHLPLERFAEHFRFRIREAPSYGPWIEGRMKRPSRLIQASFLPSSTAQGLSETNAELAEWLANRDQARWDSSPEWRERHEREQAALNPLPADNVPTLQLRMRVRPALRVG